jgi:TolB-like protein/Tfp pilus assembly protein PilF
MQNQNRQLAAILFTDIVGSTSMMQKDEQIAMSVHKRYVAVLKQSVEASDGQILNDYGDGSLCTFHSATKALLCAIEMQLQFRQEPQVPLRIGLHVGEIFFEDGQVFGDAVNVASRVQSLGIANSILFTSEICSKIKNQQEFKSMSLGKFHFKNVEEPMEVFALANDGFAVPNKKKIEGKLKEKKTARQKIIITACFVLLALAAFFIYNKMYKQAGLNEKENSIAILPFDITGNNEDNLASGLVEDILVHLSTIKEFDKVISNRSSSQYKNTKKNIQEIGEELGAVFLVTGSIQESGDKIRVSVQMIDSRNGKIILANDYTKQNIEIFNLQTELATQIVSALKTHITPEEKAGLSKHYTENVEAYKYYRKGRSFWDVRSEASYDSAEANYQKALQLDPDYALAYSGLADCYTYNQKGLTQMEAIPVARMYATKALSLDSTLAEARTTLAFIQSHFDYDWARAKASLEKIIRDNPNYPTAHLYYSNVLFFTGNMEAGFNEIRKALSLDPLSLVINMGLGRGFYYSGKYDSAIMQLQKGVILNPKFNSNYVFLGQTFVQKKLYFKSIDAFSRLPPRQFDLDYNGLLFKSLAYARAGDTVRAKALLDKVSKDDRLKSPALLAQVYVSLRNTDEALRQLEYSYETRDLNLIALKVDPAYDPIRNEPRIKALMKKMNFD